MQWRIPKPRYSLRVLFLLVAAISIWLGWEVQTVHRRKQMLEWVHEQGGLFDTYVLDEEPFPPGYVPPDWYFEKLSHFPRRRLWLGDSAIGWINLVHTSATWEQREEVAALFPEAFVMPNDPNKFARVQPWYKSK
jgi:hypothetical protein